MLYTLLRREPVVLHRFLAILTAIFLTGLLAQVRVPLPGNPVPVTMQVLAVLLTGLFLRPREAFTAMTGYLVLIGTGLPLAAGGAAGLAVLTGSTAGYLISYPFAAWFVAVVSGGESHPARSMLGALAGIGVIYGMGAGWLAYMLGSLKQGFMLGVVPFIVVDLAKAILAVFAGEGVVKSLLHFRQ